MKQINFILLLSIITSIGGFLVVSSRDRTLYPLENIIFLFPFIFLSFCTVVGSVWLCNYLGKKSKK